MPQKFTAENFENAIFQGIMDGKHNLECPHCSEQIEIVLKSPICPVCNKEIEIKLAE